jgi:hypothetical protein
MASLLQQVLRRKPVPEMSGLTAIRYAELAGAVATPW